MLEHPYLSQYVTAERQEQIERAAEQRRVLAEHADQIVARADGPLRRLFRRLLRGRSTARRADRSRACEPVTAR